MDKSLKYLVGISAIIIAGCAAYFSITGLGILFAGASVSVMVMAGSLEYAKLVTATYLKQKWNVVKGFNKWYLTTSVVILMAITSAGIFGYLSNAFQQQNLKLQQVQREIDVWENKKKSNISLIEGYKKDKEDLQKTQDASVNGGNLKSNSFNRMLANREKQSNKISEKIAKLEDLNVSYSDSVNVIKTNNINLEREVGGFRFVAEAFGVELNTVVKFFIFLIVIVFDPLAIALVIAFNQLVLGENKKEEETKEDKTKEIIEEESRLKLSENDLKILESALLNPLPPNEKLKEAAQRYSEEVREKHTHIDDFEETPIKPQLTQEERGEILAEMMKNDQELGLYDEPFDNPMIKEDLDDEVSDWDETLMDGLEDEEPFFTEEEIENILHEEPTTEEEEQNFSTIEPEPIDENPLTEENGWTPEYEEQFWEEEEIDYPPVDLEPKLSFEEGQLPDDMLPVIDDSQIETFLEEAINEFNQESIKEGFEENDERMDIIGQNGNEGLHYDNEENTSSEQDDEKKN